MSDEPTTAVPPQTVREQFNADIAALEKAIAEKHGMRCVETLTGFNFSRYAATLDQVLTGLLGLSASAAGRNTSVTSRLP